METLLAGIRAERVATSRLTVNMTSRPAARHTGQHEPGT